MKTVIKIQLLLTNSFLELALISLWSTKLQLGCKANCSSFPLNNFACISDSISSEQRERILSIKYEPTLSAKTGGKLKQNSTKEFLLHNLHYHKTFKRRHLHHTDICVSLFFILVSCQCQATVSNLGHISKSSVHCPLGQFDSSFLNSLLLPITFQTS